MINKNKLNIVIVGTTNRRAAQYISIMKEMANVIDVIESIPVETESLYEKIRYKLGYHYDKNSLNKRLIDIVQTNKIDIIFDFKSLVLNQKTIIKINSISKGTMIAFFSEDDMIQKHNNSKYFLESISYYDVIFTTKSYNVKELSELGARRVIFQNKSYDKTYHKPIKLSVEENDVFAADVSFVGTFEIERASIMLKLAQKGIKIVIWGNGWQDWTTKHQNLNIKNKAVYGDDFIKLICATKINLSFLRKANRDLQTGRSVEIPACKGFLLTERTDEHLVLFEEGKEAEYFDIENIDELENKIKYYLKNDKKRLIIAENGYQRCISSNYSHQDKIKLMLENISETKESIL